MLVLNEVDYTIFCFQVKDKSVIAQTDFEETRKSIVISTPANGFHLILTPNETIRLNHLLLLANQKNKTLIALSSLN